MQPLVPSITCAAAARCRKRGIAFGVSGVLGAFGGVWLNHQLRSELIMVCFSVVMLVAALSMLRRRAARSSISSFEERYLPGGWLRLVVVGLGAGFLTGFFGI